MKSKNLHVVYNPTTRIRAGAPSTGATGVANVARVFSWRLLLAAWAPPILWAALLFFLSATPGDDLPDTSMPAGDKLAHAAVYAVLAVLLFRAVRRTTSLARGRAAVLAVLIAIAYGATDELHQRMVPDRSPDLRDLLADAAGASAGGLVALSLSARKRLS
jgi:VanZ family protein